MLKTIKNGLFIACCLVSMSVDAKQKHEDFIIPDECSNFTAPDDMTTCFQTFIGKTKTAEILGDEVDFYALQIVDSWKDRESIEANPEFIFIVDRNPKRNIGLLYISDGSFDNTTLVGAVPVSTGTTGRYHHYLSPLGWFRKNARPLDYRAMGTKNEKGIRGNGSKGMRVFDFGWHDSVKGWQANEEISPIRFQVHATDPLFLEPRLGKPASKGCIRIPEQFNKFMDIFGVFDRELEAVADTDALVKSTLSPYKVKTPWSGRDMLVIDTGVTKQPAKNVPKPESE